MPSYAGRCSTAEATLSWTARWIGLSCLAMSVVFDADVAVSEDIYAVTQSRQEFGSVVLIHHPH